MDYQYILAYEHGDVIKVPEIGKQETQQWAEGLCEIIDVKNMEFYVGEGMWQDVRTNDT